MDYYLAIKGKEILFGAKYRTREYYVKQKEEMQRKKVSHVLSISGNQNQAKAESDDWV